MSLIQGRRFQGIKGRTHNSSWPNSSILSDQKSSEQAVHGGFSEGETLRTCHLLTFPFVLLSLFRVA